MLRLTRRSSARTVFHLLGTAGLLALLSAPVSAQVTAFKQAIAEAASKSDAVAKFYRENNYQPIWTGEGEEHRARRAALVQALSTADVHGLPVDRYRLDLLMDKMRNAETTRDLGMVEVALSRAFVTYARDIQTGVLRPSTIDDGMVRKVERREGDAYLRELETSAPGAFMRTLAPTSPQYRALLKEKLRLEHLLATGGWGPTVPVRKYEPGDSGSGVVSLRNRLIDMGYMSRSASKSYDTSLQNAVQAFQSSHGLEADGVAGKSTITEINKSVGDRLKSVIVALERERWLKRDRGARHILVNQTDFSAKIIDDGHVTFQTRSVIGKNTSDRRTPEFSDVMEHMVINPSWYVPRSIITKEYLPKLRANPGAVGHLEITDSRGRRVSRSHNFAQYSARSFPFAMRQPPGKKNALGLVKFMFPNKYNIYLHDTPQKHLFAREVRAYSHGCVRLAQPFEFAYALLAKQSESPKEFFHRVLDSGKETKVELEEHVPVHIIYRTAVISPKGQAEYRRDIYGRDAKIWSALSNAGVALSAVRG
ncbi:L,D-transpeptidase family protein [Tropicibacter sp. R16_0]|uniref:L,D-transpeptidase family protein n=1 Tax=Tropicibacter sp. R16_0 TaxID=2821102 RepID=UPI001ADBAB50|nr:L,D-transpeptidase family protein [Tropicibacter sp. R16_0]MBO9449652.1 L,D-transpeptidase family protein [Tropicibacter sp. R16_0]